ncbi:MAG: hypothetical protein H0W69_07285, partial [Gemmatimonadaceae bacterium]|nr:hypothetical protein [Gemmatimonadaceae bacterium]
VVAKSTEPVGVASVRPSASGILVNDLAKRRVIFFDTTLAKFTMVADTTPETGNAYPNRFPGSLIGFKGDSSLFFDAQSLSMLVIDPAGKIGRVMSIPSSQDAMSMGLPGAAYDGRGHIIYRAAPFPRGMSFGPNGPTGAPEFPDSVPLLRIDMATRIRDTLAWVRVQKIKMEITRSEDGRMSMSSQINPLPTVDEFAILPDGSVALIRGKDYHVDFVNADGTKMSAAKIPFDWQRLTEDDKIALIDSVKAARARMAATTPTTTIGGAGGPQIAFGGAGGGGGAPQISIQMAGPGGGGGAPGGAPRTPPQMNLVPASELPDYKPPFFAGASRADAEGNIWIRTIPTKAIAGGPVYDVINRKGELVERVQIPVNSAIVGFGPNGSVYMTVREGDNTFLQRARIR